MLSFPLDLKLNHIHDEILIGLHRCNAQRMQGATHARRDGSNDELMMAIHVMRCKDVYINVM